MVAGDRLKDEEKIFFKVYVKTIGSPYILATRYFLIFLMRRFAFFAVNFAVEKYQQLHTFTGQWDQSSKTCLKFHCKTFTVSEVTSSWVWHCRELFPTFWENTFFSYKSNFSANVEDNCIAISRTMYKEWNVFHSMADSYSQEDKLIFWNALIYDLSALQVIFKVCSIQHYLRFLSKQSKLEVC